ncbi:MAG: flagellar basal body-associated FliL family protein [Clostridium sp.]|uniref:flagellar basal body-associated FliL family protein n=1 Tax=Clostridium sp. TaxID=1506 RepID=UPI0030280CC4
MSKNSKIKEVNKENKGNSKVIIAILATILVFSLVSGAVFIGYVTATKNSPKSEVESTDGKVVDEFNLELEEFLVNLSDEGKSKYLKIDMDLGSDIANKELQVELKAKIPQIRDAINKILRTKKSTEFTPEGEAILKQQIIAGVNERLNKGKILNVYFSSIIVQ